MIMRRTRTLIALAAASLSLASCATTAQLNGAAAHHNKLVAGQARSSETVGGAKQDDAVAIDSTNATTGVTKTTAKPREGAGAGAPGVGATTQGTVKIGCGNANNRSAA